MINLSPCEFHHLLLVQENQHHKLSLSHSAKTPETLLRPETAMLAVVASIWVSMTSWFTPKVLFCVVNLMIGTIYITSNFKTKNKQKQSRGEEDDVLPNPPLVRAPSILERVRSIDFSLYRSEHPGQLQPETTHQTFPPADKASVQNRSRVEDDSDSQLVRTPSILERVKSINIPLYRSKHQNPLQPETHQTFPPPDDVAGQNQSHVEDNESSKPGPHLVRSPSLIDRIRSLNLSIYGFVPLNANPRADETPGQTQNQSHGQDHHVIRTFSQPASETPARDGVKIKKSASEKLVVPCFEDLEAIERQRPATVRETKTKGNEMASFGGDEEVDAKADDFINRFRQQLKLQRLDSIKEMWRRSGPSGK